jgi:hypothetical protein
MKKLLYCFLAFCLVFALITCNTADGGIRGGEGEGEDTEWDVDYLYPMGSSDNWPGAEVDLADRGLVDISNYESVTVNAILYTNTEGTTEVTTPSSGETNLAQFKLLKTSGGWGDEHACGPTKDHMTINGDTIWNVPETASGVPIKLLLQANWQDFTEQSGYRVKAIKVNKITFTAKTSDVLLDVVYGDSYIAVQGNKITFKNATYEDASAIYKFSSTFPTTLSGKQLVINFTIPEHTCVPSDSGGSGTEHQINFQAANSDKQKFNGWNPPDHDGVGQKYITLDDPAGGYSTETKTGTFKVPLNDLIAAAAVTADANDCKAPFTLDAIRICNNGTTWNETGGTKHIRCKSYTLVINSVTVEELE